MQSFPTCNMLQFLKIENLQKLRRTQQNSHALNILK